METGLIASPLNSGDRTWRSKPRSDRQRSRCRPPHGKAAQLWRMLAPPGNLFRRQTL